MHVGEGGLVEQARIHGTISSQVVDDLLDEPDLCGTVGGVVEEFAECLHGCLPVQPYQAADEYPQALLMTVGLLEPLPAPHLGGGEE